MQRVVAAAIATAILAVAPAAQAQTTPESAPDSAQGQFSFHKTGDGFLRLDSKTGQVSFCSHKNHGWTCETIADERTALESEIARLQNANGALKKELLARGIALPQSVRPEIPLAQQNRDIELKLPSQTDVDRVVTFVERVWKRLFEMMGNLQKDMLGKT